MSGRERFRAPRRRAIFGLSAMAFAALILLHLTATPLYATTVVVFYDNFDDGNTDGWSLAGIPGRDGGAPDIIPSPEGYALSGRNTSPHQPNTDNLNHPLSISNATELTIEMRARSAGYWTSSCYVQLYSGTDYLTSAYYEGADYGEIESAQFSRYNPAIQFWFREFLGSTTHEWHDYKWARDSEGWWSLLVDGQMESANFVQDAGLISFDGISLNPSRVGSEIEWVRVSANPVPEPISLVSGMIGFACLGRYLRHRRTD